MQERRLSPRYPFTRPVEVRGRRREVFAARSCDISGAAIGLVMARSAVIALAQGGSILTTGDQFEVVLARDGLSLDCRVRHIRRLSQEQYMVGAWFADLTPEQESALALLLQEATAVRGS